MNITKEQLKQIIKEEIESVLSEDLEYSVLDESKLQKMLGLGHEFDALELYDKALNYVVKNKGDLGPEARLIKRAINNRIVKDNISLDDPMGEKFAMLLNILDPDRPRRKGYRASIEQERRSQSKRFDDLGISKYSRERPYRIRKMYKE